MLPKSGIARVVQTARYAANTWCALLVLAIGLASASSASAATLKTLKVGLGSGTVSSPSGINCGNDCEETFNTSATVTLTAAATSGSTFVRWLGDCTGTALTCTVNTGADRSVRAEFRLNTAIPTISDFTPEGLRAYLTANPIVNSAARFLAALPADFKSNWLLMSRSESLQTGTAEFPRFLLTSDDARQVFTFGLATHSAYPGSHPDAIEYMQWDPVEKNFRFHEVVLAPIGSVPPAPMTPLALFPARARGVSIDDIKCPRCHTTRNIFNNGPNIGTTGNPPGFVKAKGKPNWDTYDSWGGMLPLNRDRVHQGSVEAAALRKLFNPWSYRTNAAVRSFIEQLNLQPAGVSAADTITRFEGGAGDGVVRFAFDPAEPVLVEPPPAGGTTISTTYSFDGTAGAPPATTVRRGAAVVTLRHTSNVTGVDEGRGVQLFDLLGGGNGQLNQTRVADEVATHRFATGSVPIDVRPLALAIQRSCLTIDSEGNRVRGTAATLDDHRAFFDARNGMAINALVDDTRTRTESVPRRKVDIQKQNLDRSSDVYLPGGGPGLLQQYGAATSGGASVSLARLRQEIFQRPIEGFPADRTVMGGIFVDREIYSQNTTPMALFRYFLEPLGVSVDKWSMGVRGRSRTYSFADIFGTYLSTLQTELTASLTAEPFPGLDPSDLSDCAALIGAVNASLSALPGVEDVPKYTDIQRIFNKGCVECHGGLNYPPAAAPFNVGYLDLSEDDVSGGPRMTRSYDLAIALTTGDPETSRLYQRLLNTSEACPFGMMPCGGPPLSKTDIETIRRWIVGGRPYSEGDPHLVTVDGVHYDFQSAGEFVLLRDEQFEVQVRQLAIETEGPLAPNEHTGLASCASINGAVAVRVGSQRITYQPDPLGGLLDLSILDEFGMDELGILDMTLDALRALLRLGGPQLRVDGRVVSLGAAGIPLAAGGRILRTEVPGGIRIQAPGGTEVVITPGYWAYYQLWYMNVDVQRARASDGVIGAIAPGNWLPALPDGSLLGPRPSDLHQRYVDLYQRFANAWRVRSSDTLFDYARGTSTNTYTIPSWPVENAYTCRLPPNAPNRPNRPPARTIPLERARLYCATVVDPARRANCVQDVSVTGNPGFANTYVATQEIEQNGAPAHPPLGTPDEDKIDLPSKVTFTWTKSADPDRDKLTYFHCVWPTDERFSFKRCKQVGSSSHKLGSDHAKALSTTVQLARSKAYYWKVIVQDETGATTESETRRFATK